MFLCLVETTLNLRHRNRFSLILQTLTFVVESETVNIKTTVRVNFSWFINCWIVVFWFFFMLHKQGNSGKQITVLCCLRLHSNGLQGTDYNYARNMWHNQYYDLDFGVENYQCAHSRILQNKVVNCVTKIIYSIVLHMLTVLFVHIYVIWILLIKYNTKIWQNYI